MTDALDIPDFLNGAKGQGTMQEFPFHALADLFPLIEGTEFDELVASIKENGLREAVITYEGAILDGRNRYRACRAAGVSPMVQPFTGRDPVRFVIDKNINRRHLNESQRAMIAATFATLKQGDVRTQRIEAVNETGDVAKTTPTLTAQQAGDLMHVHRASVINAKKVLTEGTEEEIEAVRRGEASVTTIARDIRAKTPAPERKRRRDQSLSNAGKNPERIQNMQLRAQIWGSLRDALVKLTELPLPSDVVAIAKAHDKTGLVDQRLARSLQYLEEFANAWRNRDQAAA